jgi:hypothetical protein
MLAAPCALAQAKPTQPPPQAPQQVTPEAMGVSLKNIRNQLKDVPDLPPSPGAGMRYDFYVSVFGTRPAVEFFKEFDLSTSGPVKWGGVTHQEILDTITPRGFQHFGMGVDVLAQIPRKK